MAKFRTKVEDLVAEEDKLAAKNEARNAQIKADAEMMKKKYPSKQSAGVFIVEKDEYEPEPTEKEKEMMRQMVRERKMDQGTEQGANQYEDTKMPVKKAMGGMVSGYSKGGAVTKGNGCAIRGVKKCKMY
jgi:hypothetical protein